MANSGKLIRKKAPPISEKLIPLPNMVEFSKSFSLMTENQNFGKIFGWTFQNLPMRVQVLPTDLVVTFWIHDKVCAEVIARQKSVTIIMFSKRKGMKSHLKFKFSGWLLRPITEILIHFFIISILWSWTRPISGKLIHIW